MIDAFRWWSKRCKRLQPSDLLLQHVLPLLSHLLHQQWKVWDPVSGLQLLQCSIQQTEGAGASDTRAETDRQTDGVDSDEQHFSHNNHQQIKETPDWGSKYLFTFVWNYFYLECLQDEFLHDCIQNVFDSEYYCCASVEFGFYFVPNYKFLTSLSLSG